MLSNLRLKVSKNLCVEAPFPAKKLWSALRFQAHLSLPRLPMQIMEDDGTAVDRGPRGSGSLAGLSTQPVTCVKISRV